MSLAVIELGEGHLGIGVDDGLLVDPPDPFQGADIEGVLRPAIAGAIRNFVRRLGMIGAKELDP